MMILHGMANAICTKRHVMPRPWLASSVHVHDDHPRQHLRACPGHPTPPRLHAHTVHPLTRPSPTRPPPFPRCPPRITIASQYRTGAPAGYAVLAYADANGKANTTAFPATPAPQVGLGWRCSRGLEGLVGVGVA